MAPGTARAQNASPKVVTFAQLTDIHINPEDTESKGRMKKHSIELLEDAIQHINDMKDVDFVIFTGDLADMADEKLLELFAQTAEKLNKPWYWTTGNHDLARDMLSKDRFREILNKHNKYYKPETMCYSIDKGDFMFFMMDGAVPEVTPSAHSGVSSPMGLFSKECLGMLDKKLTDNPKSPAVIFQHFPLVYPIQSFDHGVTNQKEYFKLIESHPNVKAVFAGHFHVTKISKKKHILHVASPPMIQYPDAFRVVRMEETDAGVKIDIKTVDTRLTQVRETSRIESPASELQIGKEADRTYSETLK